MELPHLKKQVVEIEGLLDSLVNHESLSEEKGAR